MKMSSMGRVGATAVAACIAASGMESVAQVGAPKAVEGAAWAKGVVAAPGVLPVWTNILDPHAPPAPGGPAAGTCPCTGGTPEGEPNCGQPTDTTNGGCNSTPPVYGTIALGETVCGTAQIGTGGVRDTDWYRFTVTATTTVQWTVRAEYPVQAALLTDVCPPALIANTNGAACADVTVVGTSLAPGTYIAFTAPSQGTPFFACMTGSNDYRGTLSAAGGPPPNDNCANATVITGNSGTAPTTTVGATNDFAGTCGASTTSPDVWFSWTAPNSGMVTFSFCPAQGGSAGYDTVLSSHLMCGGATIVCNDDSCGLLSSITFAVTGGTNYKIRVSGFSNLSGTGVMGWSLPLPPLFRLNGIAHTAEGQAQVQQQPGGLLVSNIGSSGQDGIAMRPGAVDGYVEFGLQVPQGPTGAQMTARAVGVVNGQPGQTQATFAAQAVNHPVLGPAVSLQPDFSPQGSPEYELTIKQGDTCMATIPNVSGPIIFQQPGRVRGKCGRNNLVDKCPAYAIARATLFFEGGTTLIAPGLPPMQADSIVMAPATPVVPIGPLSAVSVTAGGIPQFLVDDAATGPLLGLLYRALGGGILDSSPTSLRLSNIGSSGQDGVTMEAFGAQNAQLTMAPVNPADPPAGALVRGSAVDINNSIIVLFGANYSDSFFDVFADFSPLNANGGTVRVYNGDQLVSESPQMQLPSARIIGRPPTCRPDPVWRMMDDIWVILDLPDPLPIVVGGAPPVTGDRVVAVSQGTGPMLNGLAEITMQASNIPGGLLVLAEELTFGRPCPCDWDNSGNVNSQDFFNFLNDFFAGNADFNNDGVTNSQDFFDFLNCFFAPPPGC